MRRAHGKLRLEEGRWVLSGAPHLLLRAKRVFARVPTGAHGRLSWKNTDETCFDLAWFLVRYPLEIDPGDRAALEAGSRHYQETLLRLDQLVDKKYKPTQFELAIPARDYQKQAAELYLEHGFLLLADDLGTGKTISALCSLTEKETLPAVVVTLAGTMPRQWADMAKAFLPRVTTHVIKKSQPYPLPKIRRRGPDVVILNYHKLHTWADTLAGYAKSVIFDEAQELRRQGSNKYDAAVHLARAARFVLGLSATPIFNLGGEIWSVVNVLREDALGTYDEFCREWCTRYLNARNAPAVADPKALGSYLRAEHIMLRRTRKELGRELPPLTKIPQFVESDESALRSVEGSAAELAKIILSQENLAGWDKMKAAEEFDQVLRQATGLAKAPYVADFVRLLVDDDEPVLVFAWHRGVYDILREKLKDLNPAMFTGSETSSQKEDAMKAFMDGRTNVMFVSLRAGQGVDGLQKRCRTAVFAELDWSPGVMEQCLSSDTEILTRDGWRGKDAVSVGDQVAGFDLETGTIHWTPVLAKTDRAVGESEQMYSVETEKIDVRVTGGHRMVVRRKVRRLSGVGRSSWGCDTAERLAGQARRFVPISGCEGARGVDLTDYELKLIGWFLGDGDLNPKRRTLTIYQEVGQPWNKDIVEVLDGCGLEWKRYQRTNQNGTRMYMYHVQKGTTRHWSTDEIVEAKTLSAQGSSCKVIANAIGRTPMAVYKKLRKISEDGEGTPRARPHGPGWSRLERYLDKDLSPFLDDMTRHQLLALIHGFNMSDGAKGVKYKNVIRISNTNKTLLDRLQSLCIRRGMSAYIATRKRRGPGKQLYEIWISDSVEASIPRNDKLNGFTICSKKENERVWCVTNSFGTIVTRRHGKVTILGNCIGRIQRDGQEQPVTAYVLVTNRGSDPTVAEKLGLKTSQIEGLRDPEHEILEKLQSDSGRIKELARRYLEKLGMAKVDS